MKVVLYVNWSEKEILTEEEYNLRVSEAVADRVESRERFAEWLYDACFSPIDLFYADEEKKRKIFAEWRGACEVDAFEMYDDEYEQITLEM